jgi:hypothetical protein
VPRLSVTTPLHEMVDALNAYRPDVAVEPVERIVREGGPGAKLKLVRSQG